MAVQTGEYEIRPYEPSDREAILRLYERTLGERSVAWFEWRYVNNPYASSVPIFVAEHEGEVVGARPSLPVPLSVGGGSVTALLLVDPMVHPDHQRQGLFSRMAARVRRHYEDREPSVSIGFPNETALSALEKLGEELSLAVGVRYPFPEHYRLQNPAAMVRAATDDERYRRLGRLATPVERGYLVARRLTARTDADLGLEYVEGVPAAHLAALAASNTTPAAHARRDEEFYRWRFAEPDASYRTYLASRDGTHVAAIVIRDPAEDEELAIANLTEVVPIEGGPEWVTAVSTLVDRALDDLGGADEVTTGGAVVPGSVLWRLGFRPGHGFPLSRVSSTTYVLARPLTADPPEEWVVNGRRLADPGNWRLTSCEREIG